MSRPYRPTVHHGNKPMSREYKRAAGVVADAYASSGPSIEEIEARFYALADKLAAQAKAGGR